LWHGVRIEKYRKRDSGGSSRLDTSHPTHQVLLLGVGGILLLGPTFSFKVLRDRYATFLPLVAALLITLVVSFITSDPDPGAGSLAGAAIRYSSVSISQVAKNAVALPIHWVLAMAFEEGYLGSRFLLKIASLALHQIWNHLTPS
jgi:hypothetical protein